MFPCEQTQSFLQAESDYLEPADDWCVDPPELDEWEVDE